MANLDAKGVERIVSDAPPAHYMVQIESYSALTKHSLEKHETNVFEAGGYKWKLIIYPNGNKSKGVKEHISMYLAMVDTGSLAPGWEVYAVFRFFVLDQQNDNYLIVQDGKAKEKRFRGRKPEWGIDELLPLSMFNDAGNGYLMNDTCVFGAEVFVSTLKGENMSVRRDPSSEKHEWRIEKFSQLDKEFYDSEPFQAGDKKWIIRIYPHRKDAGSSEKISLFLLLAETESLSPSTRIYASFTLRILDQGPGYPLHVSHKANHWFSASSTISGWWLFTYRSSLYSGHFVNNICSVEAEISVLAVVNSFP